MSTRQLILTFNEDIEPTRVNVSGITIQGIAANVATNYSLQYRLTSVNQRSFSVEMHTILRIVLSDRDYGALQSRPQVATSRNNTWLTMDPVTVTDRSARRNMARRIVGGINALQVSTFIPDTIHPTLQSFSFDLNAGTMTLTFDEPVLTASFSPQQILISSHRDSTAAVSTYRLTGGNVTDSNTLASSVIEVSLSFFDLLSLISDTSLATGAFNTYLFVSMGLVTDTNHNINTMSSGVAVSSFIPDITPPELLSFVFDLNERIIVLNFNDIINASSFNASAITLQSSEARQVMQWHTLTRSSTSSPDDLQIIVHLSVNDLNVIESIPTLCTEIQNCFITLAQSVATDLSGNPVVPIPDDSALSATLFVRDTSPELNFWDLDLNQGSVTLTFSETVDALTTDATQLTLQSNSTVNSSAIALSLTNAIIASSISSPVIRILLSRSDLNTIKRHTDFGTEVNNSFLSFSARFVSDMSGNSVVPIPNSAAQVVRRFTPDTTDPELESFSLNLASGVLSLTFSETVNVSSFDITQLILVSGRYFSNDGDLTPIYGSTWEFQSGSLQNGFNSPVVIVMLSQYDLNTIIARDGLATSRNDTFLIASSRAVEDMVHNRLVYIPFSNRLQVSEYIGKYELAEQHSHALRVYFRGPVDTFTPPSLLGR